MEIKWRLPLKKLLYRSFRRDVLDFHGKTRTQEYFKGDRQLISENNSVSLEVSNAILSPPRIRSPSSSYSISHHLVKVSVYLLKGRGMGLGRKASLLLLPRLANISNYT